MRIMINKLTDEIIKNLQPKEKSYKKFDGKGLYIQITPAGGKLWQLKYYFKSKEKRLSLGSYPEISIINARKQAIKSKKALVENLDPSYEKQVLKAKKRSEIYSSKEIKNTIESIDKQIKIHEKAIKVLKLSIHNINLLND